MTKHLLRQVVRLREDIVFLGRLIEERVSRAIQAVVEDAKDKAEAVIVGDREIDELEVKLEEECLKLLALYQPVAIDLRYIVAVLKINNDLERIGDLAVNIAEREKRITELPGDVPLTGIQELSDKVKTMLRFSLLALVEMDIETANRIFQMEKEVDELNRRIHVEAIEDIKRRPQYAEKIMLMLSVSKNLERIGDQVTNIAEDVVYMMEGEIIRHKAPR